MNMYANWKANQKQSKKQILAKQMEQQILLKSKHTTEKRWQNSFQMQE